MRGKKGFSVCNPVKNVTRNKRDLCFDGIDKVRCDQCLTVLCQEFAPSDEELEAYRKGEEWDPKLAEQRRRVKVRLYA